ncbi:MAG: 30S ribosomal protein S20 [Dehalococcoidia bacterium]
MANNKSAIKRWHQSLRRRDRNRARRTLMRSASRRLREAVVEGDEPAITGALSEAYSSLDRAAKAGSIHKRQADRRKRRLAALVHRSASAT